MQMDEQIHQSGTMVLQHFDSDGNVKPIFQENRLFTFLINHGLSPNFPKIPFLLGRWQDHKEVSIK